MKVDVFRRWETMRSITGELFVDNQFECYSIEPARLTPVHPGHPCIPAGTYPFILTPSPHLKYVTPELENVPERTNIRIHIANRPEDLLGCTGVGMGHTTDWVSESEIAFERLMLLLRLSETLMEIEYHDPLPEASA